MKKFFCSLLFMFTIVCNIYAQSLGEMFAQVPNDAKAVDLGLPSGTLWSNMNLGAQKISDCGDYYAWGEVQSKDIYDFKVKTYRYYAQIDSTYVDDDGFTIVETKKGYIKYVMEKEAEKYGLNGFFDNKTSLDVEDDAAYVNWGCEWRIPTNDQLIELKNICLWKKVTLNGTNGYKVIGPNGNYIFLPAAGYCTDEYSDYGNLKKGDWNYLCYWSSSRKEYLHEAYADFYFLSDRGIAGDFYIGRPIRPVSVSTSTGIDNFNSNKISNIGGFWYTISGMKINKEPTRKGMYIHNKKKIIIK